jgi:hypothetical protein
MESDDILQEINQEPISKHLAVISFVGSKLGYISCLATVICLAGNLSESNFLMVPLNILLVGASFKIDSFLNQRFEQYAYNERLASFYLKTQTQELDENIQ